jgi:TPR repeat protein
MFWNNLKHSGGVMALALMLGAILPGAAQALPADEPAKDPNYALANEIRAFGMQTFKLLEARDFAGVEKLFQPFLDAYAARKISAEDLALRFDPFTGMMEMEPELDGWIKAYPKSYAARLARGIYFVEEAWRKRGVKMGNKTSEAQFAGFRRYLQKSHDELTAALALYSRPVDSYRYLIRVDKGMSGDEARSLLDKALQLDPAALDPRLEYMYSIQPRWGGSVEEMEDFLQETLRSPMTAENKRHFQGKHYYELAQEARLAKDFRAGSEYFYQGYKATGEENALLFSAEIAIDADDPKLALMRLDELLRVFPKSSNGYDYRAKVYEYKFNDAEHAIPDYIKAADLGSSWSQNHMGWFYMKGIQVPVDFKKARHYLELAAAQGNQTAKENLVILSNLEKGR